MDTQGFVLLKVVVWAADVQGRDGPGLPRLERIWADLGDAAYSGGLVDELRTLMGWNLEIVKRSDTQPRTAFAVQPHR